MAEFYGVVVRGNWERRVVRTIKVRANYFHLPEIVRVVVPTVPVAVRAKDGSVGTRRYPAMPGYVLVEMDATPEAVRVVRSTAGVLGFAGAVSLPGERRKGWEKRPLVPIPREQVEALLERHAGMSPAAPPAPKAGSGVRVRSGPLAGQVGVVAELTGHGRALVAVETGERPLPVEVDVELLEVLEEAVV